MGLVITSEFYPSGQDGFIHRYAYTAGGDVEYHGWAKPGIADTARGWCIVKYTYTDGNCTAIDFPQDEDGIQTNGNVFIWGDRAEYNYGAL